VPRRSFSVFSLSFLDVMACGLGATILFLMIISAQVRVRADQANEQLLAVAAQLSAELEAARVELQSRRAAGQPADPVSEIERLRRLIAELSAKADAQAQSLAAREDPAQLRSDVARLQESIKRLAETVPTESTGARVRSFVGQGNRQYLTGMKVGGSRILVLVDTSTSMLGRTYANVIRYKVGSDARKVRAPKWRQTIATVEWLTTQLQPGARFQIYGFNESAATLIEGSNGDWITANDQSDFRAMSAGLRKVVPGGGTSLIRAFEAAAAMKPVPDNIFLITDGLPTQGANPPSQVEPVAAERRVNYLRQAWPALPPKVPVNVILLAMEGDPQAAYRFWELAERTRGSFLAPSRDWP
jgi:hypothetical protein